MQALSQINERSKPDIQHPNSDYTRTETVNNKNNNKNNIHTDVQTSNHIDDENNDDDELIKLRQTSMYSNEFDNCESDNDQMNYSIMNDEKGNIDTCEDDNVYIDTISDDDNKINRIMTSDNKNNKCFDKTYRMENTWEYGNSGLNEYNSNFFFNDITDDQEENKQSGFDKNISENKYNPNENLNSDEDSTHKYHSGNIDQVDFGTENSGNNSDPQKSETHNKKNKSDDNKNLDKYDRINKINFEEGCKCVILSNKTSNVNGDSSVLKSNRNQDSSNELYNHGCNNDTYKGDDADDRKSKSYNNTNRNCNNKNWNNGNTCIYDNAIHNYINNNSLINDYNELGSSGEIKTIDDYNWTANKLDDTRSDEYNINSCGEFDIYYNIGEVDKFSGNYTYQYEKNTLDLIKKYITMGIEIILLIL